MIMPYQIYRRAVPTSLTSAMLNIACRGPEGNRELIEGEGVSKLLLTSDKSQRPAHVSLIKLPRKYGTIQY
jgi:eukaryotic translation initiation factor 2C